CRQAVAREAARVAWLHTVRRCRKPHDRKTGRRQPAPALEHWRQRPRAANRPSWPNPKSASLRTCSNSAPLSPAANLGSDFGGALAGSRHVCFKSTAAEHDPVPKGRVRAFSSEVDTGSREENASKQ